MPKYLSGLMFIKGPGLLARNPRSTTIRELHSCLRSIRSHYRAKKTGRNVREETAFSGGADEFVFRTIVIDDVTTGEFAPIADID